MHWLTKELTEAYVRDVTFVCGVHMYTSLPSVHTYKALYAILCAHAQMNKIMAKSEILLPIKLSLLFT